MKKLFLISLILTLPLLTFSQLDLPTYKFGRVLSLANNYYVDSINSDKLVEAAIVGLLKELDPHSVYITKEEVDEMNEPLEGSFDGVGIQFNILDDTLLVVNPIPNGPSEKLGIKAGDRIIEIDAQLVAGVGLKNSEVVKKLRGQKGTTVNIKILRKNNKNLLDFTITRDKIPIYSLDASYMIDNEIGYIKLNRFSATTMDEFNKAFASLKEKGLKSLIIDLRGNGGGYLNTAVSLTNQFLEEGKMIVYTEGLHNPRYEELATKNGAFLNGKLAILVDEGSASASEILSGAIQDHDRGIIVGRRTFGKGLVQRPYLLPDNSMIRLTVARYYTPSGRCIQKSYENGDKDYSEELIKRYDNGELLHADSIHFPENLKYNTLKYKRTVYGGGGIMPDIFTPIDTTKIAEFYSKLVRSGTIYQYTVDYMDKHRETLTKKYSDFDTFNKTFVADKDLFDGLYAKAEKDKIKFTDEDKAKSLKDNTLLIKALIARDLWDMSEYFQVVNPENDAYTKAIEALKNDKTYQNILKNTKK
jgi:carboxyl-terminal processing protease